MKATVSITYTASLDIGDVPIGVIKAAIEANELSDGDFNVWKFKDSKLAGVEVVYA